MSIPSEDSPSAPPFLQHRSSAFEHFWDAVIVTNPDHRIIDWNPGATRTFGWMREEILGRRPSLLHRPGDAQALEDSILQGVSETGQWSGEITFVRKDGSTGVCATRVVPMRDAEGALLNTLWTHREITAEKAAEGTLIQEQLLLRTLIDALDDLIFFKDREHRLLLVNAALKRLWNLALDEAIGKTDADIPALRKYAELYAADDERVLQTGEPIINREEPFDDINGEQGWFLTSKYPLRDSKGVIVGLVGTCRNVTEKRRADLALANEREKLRTILDAVQDPVFVKDLQGRHIMRNAAGMRLFGRSLESNDGTVYELPMPREYADLYTKDDRFVLETGIPIVNREEPFLLPDGSEGYLLTSKSPLRDGAGRIVGLVGIGRDITQMRKDAKEREALHAKLRETQKLESLGILAGGIAHDFNNLLTGILGHASLAAMDLPPGSPVQDCIEQITEASMRAADLCKQMLAYSGRGHFYVQKLELGRLVEQTTQMLQISISKKAALHFRLEKDVPPVEVDATQIRQVIMNLVINASEAIGEKSGVITISTGVAHVDRAYLAATLIDHDLPEGDYVFLQVSDTGCGMSRETQSKIFDPFFTTKFTGRGLGLAAVLGIVRGHKGAMKVDSEVGRGATFKLLFPAAPGGSETSAPRAAAIPTWKGKGTVLVVDDEETMRITAARMMHKFGIEPVLASDGREAVEIFRAQPDRFGLVLLDLTMPQMDGEQTFTELRRLCPGVRVVLMSGFDAQEAMLRFPGKALVSFLQKPFTIDTLRAILQNALE
jgi:two-component system, cell cycle sensor histidine kinase and response regulator CckA